jgi:hypothetical protein
MKKGSPFVILCSLLWILWIFLIVCPGTKAQWHKPYGSCQWEGAQVQRLTYNSSPNEVKGFYIDENDELLLVYQQWWFDSLDWTWLDTLFLTTKEKNGGWSQPEVIGNPSLGMYYVKSVGYDPRADVIHLFYDCGYSSHCGDTLYYTNSNMPNWGTVKTDTGSDRVHVGSMAFDSLGNIHLLWNVGFDSIGYHWYRVMYANNSTGQWVKQQVSPPVWLGSYGGTGASSFGVQKDGTAHVMYQGEPYCDLECVSFYVRNDSLNSTNWVTDTIPKPSRPLWHYGPGLLEVDVKDRVHLITGGCIVEYCGPWSGDSRGFYYYKEPEDSIWTGPDVILDSVMYIMAHWIDDESVPYVAEWDPFSYCWFFADRKQGFWQEPYQILDTTSMCNALSSIYSTGFWFVLDSEGGGHAVFAGCLFEFQAQDDSFEIFYYGAPFTLVEDTLEDQRRFRFELFQNYPNPFNQSTLIRYSLNGDRPTSTTLTIYNILGKEVRELVNTRQSSGNYTITWDGKDNNGKEVSSGIYLYQLQAGNYKQTRKLVLVR